MNELLKCFLDLKTYMLCVAATAVPLVAAIMAAVMAVGFSLGYDGLGWSAMIIGLLCIALVMFSAGKTNINEYKLYGSAFYVSNLKNGELICNYADVYKITLHQGMKFAVVKPENGVNLYYYLGKENFAAFISVIQSTFTDKGKIKKYPL